MYEQLQEFLDTCIELGWRKGKTHKSFMSCDITGIYFMSRDESVEKSEHMSYHELFSKDSGIMEFVKRWPEDVRGHYFLMSMLTAEEKIKYFLENAKLPTK